MKNQKNTLHLAHCILHKKTYLLLVLCSLFLTIGCKKPNNDNPTDNDPIIVMQNAKVSGVVLDIDGSPIVDVRITSGEESVLTNAQGVFTFARIGVVDSRTIINFEKTGYFKVVRSGVKKSEMQMQVVMRQKGNSAKTVSTNFSASSAKTLSVAGMEVKISASSLKTASGGNFSGIVNADMFYLAPDDPNIAVVMPGSDLAALNSNGDAKTLISLGMTEVSLTDNNGNKLQLAEGQTAELNFPIPAEYASNPPATVPLWSFNEKTGLWEEEGMATLQGNVYVGNVSHFSWHNLDNPADRVTFYGYIVDCHGDRVGGDYLSAGQTSAIVDANGMFSFDAPANTPVSGSIAGGLGTFYHPGAPGGSTINLGNITVPCRPKVCITITNTCGNSTTATVYVDWGSGQSMPVSADGDVCISVPVDASGDAWVYGQVPGGGLVGDHITLSGGNVNHNLNICSTAGPNTGTASGSASINPPGQPPIVVEVQGDVIGFLDYVDSTFATTISLNSPLFTLSIPDGFMEGVNIYNNGAVVYSLNSATAYTIYSAENVTVTLSNMTSTTVDVTFSGTGTYTSINMQTYEQTILENVPCSGTVTLPYITSSYNVAWANSGINSVVPMLYNMIDVLIWSDMSGYGTKAWCLWAGKTASDYSSVKTKLQNAGFNVVSSENTDPESGETHIEYQKGFTSVILDFNPNGCNNADGIGNQIYTLSVEITTLNMK